MNNLGTFLILFVCITFFSKTLIAQENQEERLQIFARVGNGIVVNEAMDAIGFGIGLERAMSRRWVFRAEVGYEWDQYENSVLESEILTQAGINAYSRAINASISAIHYWSIGSSARHQVGLGAGVSARLFQWRGITEYVVLNNFNRAPVVDDLITATIDKQEEDIGSLLLGFYYKSRLTERIGIGAFCRYDLNAYQAQESPLRREFRVSEEGRLLGQSNKFQSFVDGPRAVTLGFQMFYTF